MIEKIDHIGIAVTNLEEAMKPYLDFLFVNKGSVEIEEVSDQKVKVAVFHVGPNRIELLQSTAPDGTIAKFIEKKGEGIHHLAVRVKDIEKALAELKVKGIKLIDEKPRIGAGGAKIAFLHPKSTGGILIELTERKEE
ncbi:MAG: methylmalonyl-CoA epimerase [Thermoplasmata archaeon]